MKGRGRMKKVWLAVALLILIPALLVVIHLYLGHTTAEMIEQLQKADTLAAQGKDADAEREVKEFLSLWKRKRNILATFTRHSELDPANLGASRLLPLLRNGETGDFSAECQSLVTQLDHILESDNFSIDNIL